MKKRGATLVIVLVVTAALLIIGTAVSGSVINTMKLNANYSANVDLELAAKSGLSILKDNLIKELSSVNKIENLPNEFEEKMKALLGDEFEDYIKCYDEPRYYGLRVNTEKISVEDFVKICPFEITPIPWIDNGFYYDGEKISPAKHPYYFAGLYYLQEPSAMTPANRLPVEPGDKVLDVCAAPGGFVSVFVVFFFGVCVLIAFVFFCL